MQKVLTIAGSDSGGGAGIQADIKTISACGCYAASAITAITAQNTLGVRAIHPLPAAIVEQQIRAVLDDIGADALKIGMLATPQIVELTARLIAEYKPRHVVIDPVLVATSGDRLTQSNAIQAMVECLLPLATVVTPNIPETEQLFNFELQSQADISSIGDRLSALGISALLVKGGHLGGDTVVDTLFFENKIKSYSHPRIVTRNTHGTGCSLSAAIASFLALGHPLPEAVEQATNYLHGAIQAAVDQRIGQGSGPIHHFFK